MEFQKLKRKCINLLPKNPSTVTFVTQFARLNVELCTKCSHMFWKKKAKTPKSHALAITEENFKEVVMQSDKPVLVDFWASWCGPCKIIGPIIDELSGEYEGKAIIGKINTEQQQRLAATFQIRSIPTLMIFKDGKMVERFSGVVPKPNLEEILDGYISE